MTATNHVLTGAVTATFITNPIIALPVAFLLHFVLDSLPHYGNRALSPADAIIFKKSRKFMAILFSDMAVAASFLLSIAFIQPDNWLLIIACGIACASPDLMWLPRWLNEVKGVKNRPLNKIESFHKNIQWGERPWGWILEIAWFLPFFVIYLNRTAP